MTAFQKYQQDRERERNRVTEPAPHVSRYHQRYLDEVAARWGITELQIEGMEKPEPRTLADDIRARDVIEAKGSRLVSTVGSYQEKPFRVWLEIRL